MAFLPNLEKNLQKKNLISFLVRKGLNLGFWDVELLTKQEVTMLASVINTNRLISFEICVMLTAVQAV